MAATRIRLHQLIYNISEEEVTRAIPPKFIVEDLQGTELGRTVLFEDAVELYLKRYPYVKKKEVAHPFITKIE